MTKVSSALALGAVFVSVGLSSLVSLSGSARAEEPRRITIGEAIRLALQQNLDVRSSDLQEQADDDDARSTRGNLLPKFKVEGGVLFYDSAYAPCNPFDPAAVALGPSNNCPIASARFLIRNENVNSLTLSANQPLTAEYAISKRWRAQQELAAAARADGTTLRAELVYRTAEAYLRLLQAIDVATVARETITDIEDQVRLAQALVTGGTLIQADLLRAQVQLAQSKQDLLRAEADVGVAKGGLAIACGLPVDAAIEAVPIDPKSLPKLPAQASDFLPDAERNRPEVQAANLRAAAAVSVRKAAWADMLPQLSVSMQYQHYDGLNPLLQQPNFFYAGGFLSWNFWEWGTQFYASEAAKVRSQLADNEVARRRRDVSLDAYRRFLEARASFAAIEVARTAVSQAQEAQRVTKALYENGSATTTDLLNAELALESARVNDARSTYEALIAYAAFERAAGSAAELPRVGGHSAGPRDKTPFSD